MWNAETGKLHATYSPYNHLDEVTHAFSLAFDPAREGRLYAGFDSCIRVFDLSRPGRQIEVSFEGMRMCLLSICIECACRFR
jgi:hypothetical protein